MLCALCAVLESISSMYFGGPAPWSFMARRRCLRASGMVWSGVDDLCAGDVETPFLYGEASFLVESGITVTVVTWWQAFVANQCVSERDLITGKRYS